MPDRWRVSRVSGLLVPGFTKSFTGDAGTTRFAGIPIGRFDVAAVGDGTIELLYRRWPIVDVLAQQPSVDVSQVSASGWIRLPGGRRTRFCRFRLTRH